MKSSSRLRLISLLMSVMVICGLVFHPSVGLPVKDRSSSPVLFSFPIGTSWNTAVTCQPSLVTVRDILGSQENSNGGATFAGGWNQSIPNKRATSPPCSVNGKLMLVEIHGVVLPVLSATDECGDSGYSPPIPSAYCDSTGNIEDQNDHTFDPNTNMVSMHTENDMNWKYNGVAYPNAPEGIQIDVQGFVYWDPGHTGDSWHSYSGWELHPLTAWRLSSSSQPPPSQPPNNQPGPHCLLCVETLTTISFLWLFVFAAMAGLLLSLVLTTSGAKRRLRKARNEYSRPRNGQTH